MLKWSSKYYNYAHASLFKTWLLYTKRNWLRHTFMGKSTLKLSSWVNIEDLCSTGMVLNFLYRLYTVHQKFSEYKYLKRKNAHKSSYKAHRFTVVLQSARFLLVQLSRVTNPFLRVTHFFLGEGRKQNILGVTNPYLLPFEVWLMSIS